MQVSPAEIEDVLLSEPSGIVHDVAVAGVQIPGARMSDERSPRAWIVLSKHGWQMGERQAREALEDWTNKNLSKYKWLRGGIQFVQEVSDVDFWPPLAFSTNFFLFLFRLYRFPRTPQARRFQVNHSRS